MIFVTVIEPRDREIYINGVYEESVGTSPTVVVLNAGSHIFETLTPKPGPRLVDFAGSVDNVPDMGSETIDLSPVHPPKPKNS